MGGWSQYGCDRCQEGNWILASDSYKLDPVQSCKCWVCGNAFLIDDLESCKECYWNDWEECAGNEDMFRQRVLECAEDGSPEPYWGSADHERFLDSECPHSRLSFSDGECTWRFWLLDIITEVYGGPSGEFPTGRNRVHRRDIIDKIVSGVDPEELWCKLLASGFVLAGKEIREHLGWDDEGKGRWGEMDLEKFRQELKGVLVYLYRTE